MLVCVTCAYFYLPPVRQFYDVAEYPFGFLAVDTTASENFTSPIEARYVRILITETHLPPDGSVPIGVDKYDTTLRNIFFAKATDYS